MDTNSNVRKDALPLRTWKLALSYDGSDFSGWQVQPGLSTIQGELAAAVERVTGESVLPQGAGRTDTGVHAFGQVVSFELSASIPEANLQRALNRALPSSVRVLSAEVAPRGFHARYSAKAKSYEYRIFLRGTEEQSRICPPLQARFVWDCPLQLNIAAMQKVAQCVIGEHDFSSFMANDPDLATRNLAVGEVEGGSAQTNNIRTIFSSEWKADGETLVYRIRGNGFLHHMVRNLVGTFVEVGCGRLTADAFPAVLAARDRSAAGPTAPACGLFLVCVEY